VATFEGTSQEFKRYIGPRLRNVVNLLTKKQKAEIGACEHCGSSENLESAHVLGRNRTEIIDLLLGTSSPGDTVSVDLGQFEEAFRSEHEPFEKAILVLCRECHRKYDSKAIQQNATADVGHMVDAVGVSPGSRSPAWGILPITLDPSRVSVFKDRLLSRKAAEIVISYADGRTERRPWDASKFSEASSVFENLRSAPEFRQGEWQSLGIVKVHVRVLGDT
jgi:hypothetical protein